MHHPRYTVADCHVMNGLMPGSVYVAEDKTSSALRTGLTVGGVVIPGLTASAWRRHHKKDQARKAQIAKEQAAGEAEAPAEA